MNNRSGDPAYDAFWLRYLRAHADPRTRALHYAGSVLSLACLVLAAALHDWRWLIGAPVVGYAFAWTAHFGIEGNKPETFGHPFWSLASDFRMLSLAATGRLAAHLASCHCEERSGCRARPGKAI